MAEKRATAGTMLSRFLNDSLEHLDHFYCVQDHEHIEDCRVEGDHDHEGSRRHHDLGHLDSEVPKPEDVKDSEITEHQQHSEQRPLTDMRLAQHILQNEIDFLVEDELQQQASQPKIEHYHAEDPIFITQKRREFATKILDNGTARAQTLGLIFKEEKEDWIQTMPVMNHLPKITIDVGDLQKHYEVLTHPHVNGIVIWNYRLDDNNEVVLTHPERPRYELCNEESSGDAVQRERFEYDLGNGESVSGHLIEESVELGRFVINMKIGIAEHVTSSFIKKYRVSGIVGLQLMHPDLNDSDVNLMGHLIKLGVISSNHATLFTDNPPISSSTNEHLKDSHRHGYFFLGLVPYYQPFDFDQRSYYVHCNKMEEPSSSPSTQRWMASSPQILVKSQAGEVGQGPRVVQLDLNEPFIRLQPDVVENIYKMIEGSKKVTVGDEQEYWYKSDINVPTIEITLSGIADEYVFTIPPENFGIPALEDNWKRGAIQPHHRHHQGNQQQHHRGEGDVLGMMFLRCFDIKWDSVENGVNITCLRPEPPASKLRRSVAVAQIWVTKVYQRLRPSAP